MRRVEGELEEGRKRVGGGLEGWRELEEGWRVGGCRKRVGGGLEEGWMRL